MNDAERYNREWDLIRQELAADEEFKKQTLQKQCDAVWKRMEKHCNAQPSWKDWKNWTPAKMEHMTQWVLDVLFSERDP